MTDECDLIAAILAQPDDDNVRLVYADWLQEHDQELRAVYIRDAVRLSRPHEFPEGSAAAVIFYGAVVGSVVLAPPHPGLAWTVNRGFVEEVRCPADIWLKRADAILREHPVRRADLSMSGADNALLIHAGVETTVTMTTNHDRIHVHFRAGAEPVRGYLEGSFDGGTTYAPVAIIGACEPRIDRDRSLVASTFGFDRIRWRKAIIGAVTVGTAS